MEPFDGTHHRMFIQSDQKHSDVSNIEVFIYGLRELLDAKFSKTLDNGLDEDDVEALVYMLAAG